MTDNIAATVTETATKAPLSTIAHIGEHEGQTVTLHGWLYNLRESGKLLFPIFRDGSGTIQGIVPKAAVTPKGAPETERAIEEEEDAPKESAAAELGRKGGAARAKNMTPERRAEIAKKAAAKRWHK